MMKIKSIAKSTKKEGYAYVVTDKGNLFRKIYLNREGISRPSINLEADIYSFDWENEEEGCLAVNIKHEKNYSKKGKTKIDLNEIRKEKKVVIEENPEVEIKEVKNGEVRHNEYETIKIYIENDVPVYLAGPAGSGKNHTLEQIAKDLGVGFYFTNSVQQEYKLTGFIDAGGKYHETEFYKAFLNGGIFFLDEMDASIPEVLVLLNAAIANKYFEFPNGKISAHEDFRVVAAGNTVGNGADEQYVGRLTLDQATLDRFAIIEFDYCLEIELHISKYNNELVNFIRNLRKQSKEKGIRATFSYRCITMVTKLEGKLPLSKIFATSVFKGMDKDTINTFSTYDLPRGSKYVEALEGLKMGA